MNRESRNTDSERTEGREREKTEREIYICIDNYLFNNRTKREGRERRRRERRNRDRRVERERGGERERGKGRRRRRRGEEHRERRVDREEKREKVERAEKKTPLDSFHSNNQVPWQTIRKGYRSLALGVHEGLAPETAKLPMNKFGPSVGRSCSQEDWLFLEIEARFLRRTSSIAV